MPWILYDFKCPQGHQFESLESTSQALPECPECFQESTRVISPVKCKLDPLSFPGAGDKWIREHEKAGGASEG